MGQQLRKKPTPTQERVLELYTKRGCWPAEISRRLQISRAAVSKHMTALRNMGLIGGVNTVEVNDRCTPQGVPESVNPLRLHGEEFRVEIISSSEKYHRTRMRASSVLIDGNRVVLYRDVIMIFSYQSFYGADVDACDREASYYWLRFFRRLESLYGLLLLKDRRENIKRVKAHYGETGNELADELRRKKQKLRVFGTLDGKEWLLFDDSSPDGLGLNEAETTHSSTPKDGREAREDMQEVVQPFFNDLRDRRPPLPSEQAKSLGELRDLLALQAQLDYETKQDVAAIAKGLRVIVNSMQPPQPELPPMTPSTKPDYFG